eukprot:scaffold157664_cov13-Tisochrysis_lutea.AAC.1
MLGGSSFGESSSSEPKRLELGALVRVCEEGLASFSPSRTSIDSHVEAFLKERRVRHADDAGFVQQ